MMPLRAATTTTTRRTAAAATQLLHSDDDNNRKNQQQQQQQQKTRKGGDVTVVIEIEVAIKALDRHIERLEAKLLFLIKSYNDDPRTDLSDEYKKKIATIKQEIDDAMEQRRTSNSLRQMSVIRYSTF
jgi:uncharacterized small protein (DUF1192 family)